MITIGTLLRVFLLNIRTASFVSGSFFVVVGASEVNGIDEVVVAVSVDITAGIFAVVDDTDDAPVFVK